MSLARQKILITGRDMTITTKYENTRLTQRTILIFSSAAPSCALVRRAETEDVGHRDLFINGEVVEDDGLSASSTTVKADTCDDGLDVPLFQTIKPVTLMLYANLTLLMQAFDCV
jgi:hypothetical protein